jgi:hypothetical protein
MRRSPLYAAAFFLLAACGPKTAESAAAPAEAKRGEGPAIWRVSDEDSTIYLFGTFHILPSSATWTTAAFDAAMKETPATMTEVDTKSAEAQAKMAALVQQLGLNPPGVTLSKTLGEARAKRFAAIVGEYGARMEELEPLKPWLAMISLSVLIMQKEGFNADSGAETTILARAASEGDAVSHLESAEYQIRALASLDEDEILADFDSSLDQLAEFDQFAGRVLSAWRTGDVVALEKETLAPMRDTAPGAFKTLITDRNRNWAREIERIMAGDDDVFIAVGAGHLVGEDSVVDLLEDKGLAVRRVQ